MPCVNDHVSIRIGESDSCKWGLKIASLEYIAVLDKLCLGCAFRSLSIDMKQHEKTEKEVSYAKIVPGYRL